MSKLKIAHEATCKIVYKKDANDTWGLAIYHNDKAQAIRMADQYLSQKLCYDAKVVDVDWDENGDRDVTQL